MNYFLVNAVSKRRTKMARKAGPAPQKYSQRFLGGSVRLTRGRHHPITEEQLKAHWDELEAKQRAGAVEVRVGTPMGPIFDFGTLDTKPEPVKKPVEPEEVVDAAPEPEDQDDAEEGEPSEEVELPAEEPPAEDEPEEAQDFASMTNKQLVALILEHSSDWTEKELKKMKKVELLELLT